MTYFGNCIDINECEREVCGFNEVCINTKKEVSPANPLGQFVIMVSRGTKVPVTASILTSVVILHVLPTTMLEH